MTYKILVVDDNLDLLNVMREIIKLLGYSTETAEDGQVALKKLEQMSKNGNGLPSLLISDINMPHIDGIKLVERCQELYSALPILITTGELLNHQIELDRLRVPYLAKPYRLHELKDKIEEILSI